MNRATGPPFLTGSPSIFTEARGNNSDSTDSRLLDAAQTLVTLQQTSGASPTGLGHHRRPQQQQQQSGKAYRDEGLGLPRGHRMAPPPPAVSAGSTSMGPPPPPSSATSVTTRYVVLQTASPSRGPVVSDSAQASRLLALSDQGTMQPPSQLPPPSRGRGRGSKRGGGMTHQQPSLPAATPPAPSGRGRGRGRGRGLKATSTAVPPVSNPANAATFHDSDDDGDLADIGAEGLNSQAEEEEKRKKKNGATFMVGSIPVRNAIFDEILNERKLELLLDPEVMAVLEKHRSKPVTRNRTLSNSGNPYMN